MRDQIRAVYDCGYDEWLLWDAACTYDWDGLLTPEAADAETEEIAASRAMLPETTYAPEEAGHDALTVTEGAQNGDSAAVSGRAGTRSDGGGFSGGPGAFRSVGNGRRTRHSAGDRNHAAADGVGQKRKVWQEGSLQYQVRQHS